MICIKNTGFLRNKFNENLVAKYQPMLFRDSLICQKLHVLLCMEHLIHLPRGGGTGDRGEQCRNLRISRVLCEKSCLIYVIINKKINRYLCDQPKNENKGGNWGENMENSLKIFLKVVCYKGRKTAGTLRFRGALAYS